ncbi:hypothetical protein AB1328_20960 [Streptomyces virginiae]|uniref:transposase n=1 Tax=Streptomyces TaxID=1883 RepID=UPI00215669D9|nr:transposase [Streptomyces sp. INR7]
MENWNSANTVLHHGKDSALTGPDKEHADTSMLALRPLQSVLVHINTLLLQQRLGEEAVRRGPARTDWAVLVEHLSVRHLPPRHGQAARPAACPRARVAPRRAADDGVQAAGSASGR